MMSVVRKLTTPWRAGSRHPSSPHHAQGRWGSLARRLAHFWIVWSALLLVHEAGHAIVARQQNLAVRSVTVGVGPIVWRDEVRETRFTLRLVPLAGLTNVAPPARPREPEDSGENHAGHSALTLAGGVLATSALVILLVGIVAVQEGVTLRRCVWGRIVIADAMVLSVFNFLPVPPLDGGRALLSAVAAVRGAPLAADTLFWFHLGGLALAAVPMMLWTRWTRRMDATALWWHAPGIPPAESESTRAEDSALTPAGTAEPA